MSGRFSNTPKGQSQKGHADTKTTSESNIPESSKLRPQRGTTMTNWNAWLENLKTHAGAHFGDAARMFQHPEFKWYEEPPPKKPKIRRSAATESREPSLTSGGGSLERKSESEDDVLADQAPEAPSDEEDFVKEEWKMQYSEWLKRRGKLQEKKTNIYNYIWLRISAESITLLRTKARDVHIEEEQDPVNLMVCLEDTHKISTLGLEFLDTDRICRAFFNSEQQASETIDNYLTRFQREYRSAVQTGIVNEYDEDDLALKFVIGLSATKYAAYKVAVFNRTQHVENCGQVVAAASRFFVTVQTQSSKEILVVEQAHREAFVAKSTSKQQKKKAGAATSKPSNAKDGGKDGPPPAPCKFCVKGGRKPEESMHWSGTVKSCLKQSSEASSSKKKDGKDSKKAKKSKKREESETGEDTNLMVEYELSGFQDLSFLICDYNMAPEAGSDEVSGQTQQQFMWMLEEETPSPSTDDEVAPNDRGVGPDAAPRNVGSPLSVESTKIDDFPQPEPVRELEAQPAARQVVNNSFDMFELPTDNTSFAMFRVPEPHQEFAADNPDEMQEAPGMS